MGQADALLLPSLREDASFVVAEAQGVGMPVVAFDHGGPAGVRALPGIDRSDGAAEPARIPPGALAAGLRRVPSAARTQSGAAYAVPTYRPISRDRRTRRLPGRLNNADHSTQAPRRGGGSRRDDRVPDRCQPSGRSRARARRRSGRRVGGACGPMAQRGDRRHAVVQGPRVTTGCFHPRPRSSTCSSSGELWPRPLCGIDGCRARQYGRFVFSSAWLCVHSPRRR